MIVLTTRKPEINSRVETPGSMAGITLASFKIFLKWAPDDTSEDAVMTSCLVTTIKQAESYTRRVIDPATWRTYLQGFYDFTFDVAPVTVASIAVKYYDSANTLQTLNTSLYEVTNRGNDDYASIEFTGTMPELYDRNEPVYVEYPAGYATYPDDLKDIIMHQAADYFESRTNDLPGSMDQVTFGFHQRLFPYKML